MTAGLPDLQTAGLQSAVPGMIWPPLPAAPAAMRLALLHQIEQSQWLDAATLRHRQFGQLRPLLAHAFAHVPFWRARLEAAGLSPDMAGLETLWERIAPLTRSDVQEAGTALDAASVPPAHGPSGRLSSSGSTGTPVSVLKTALAGTIWDTLTLRDHMWHGRDLTQKLAAIRRLSGAAMDKADGVPSPLWGRWARGLTRTGPAIALHINMDVERQLAWLQGQNPGYLLTYPSNLAALLALPEAARRRPPALKQVLTIAEALTPELRAACLETWGVPVIDTYSAQETGYIALQCPRHPHYHAQAETMLVEILDDRNRPCAPGAVGRVVVTPLHNFATPLIRYELGDYAEVGPPCGCGRGLPVLNRIAGRVRNMLVGADGRRYWPSFVSWTQLQAGPIRQIQFVQTRLDTIEARLVAERPLTPEEERAFCDHVRSRLPPPFRAGPFSIVIAYRETIGRSAGGKFEDFISEVAAAPVDPPPPPR